MRLLLLLLLLLVLAYGESEEDVITVSFSDSDINEGDGKYSLEEDTEPEVYDEEDVEDDDEDGDSIDENFVQEELERAVYDPACKNSGENPHCASWAFFGECSRNPDYMISSCEKSCYVCSGIEVQDVKLDERLLPLDAIASRFPDITISSVEVCKRLLAQLKNQLQGGVKNEIYKEKFAVGVQGEMFMSIMNSIYEQGTSYAKKEEKRLHALIHSKQFRRTVAVNSEHGYTVQKKHMLVMRWQTLGKFKAGRNISPEYETFATKLIDKEESAARKKSEFADEL